MTLRTLGQIIRVQCHGEGVLHCLSSEFYRGFFWAPRLAGFELTLVSFRRVISILAKAHDAEQAGKFSVIYAHRQNEELRCWIDKELSRTALNDVAVVRVKSWM